jgi:restriction endonuclease S subunit
MVNPEFLAWYLNHPTLQSYLDQQAKGSNVRVISRVEAARIPVLLPALAQQKAIVQLHQLRLTETRLLHDLETQKNLLLDTMLWQRLAALTEEAVAQP